MAEPGRSAAPSAVFLRLRPGHVMAAAMAIAPSIAALAPLGIAPLFSGLVVAAAGLHLAHRRGWPRLGWWAASITCALLGWAALTAIWTVATPETQRFLPRLAINLVGAIGLVLVAQSMSEAERQLIRKWLLVGFAVGVVLFIVEAATDGAVAAALNRILLGTTREFQYGSLSRGAAFLAIFGFFAALAARRRYGMGGVALLLALTVVAVSFVHGYKALAGVAIGVVVAVGGYLLRHRVVFLVASALVLLIATAPLQIKVLDAIDGPWSRSDNASVTHRLMIWRFVHERIAERPVQGWGLNSSRAIPGGHEGPHYGTEFLPLHPHNAPLQLWLELGGIGALIAAFAVASAILFLCRRFHDRVDVGLATAATAAAATVGAVGYGAWQGWWLATIWLAAASLAALAPTDATQDSLVHNA